MVYNAVVALGVVAGALPWTQYQQLLGQFLRLMKRHADSNKARGSFRGLRRRPTFDFPACACQVSDGRST